MRLLRELSKNINAMETEKITLVNKLINKTKDKIISLLNKQIINFSHNILSDFTVDNKSFLSICSNFINKSDIPNGFNITPDLLDLAQVYNDLIKKGGMSDSETISPLYEYDNSMGSYFKFGNQNCRNKFDQIISPLTHEDWKIRNMWDSLCFGESKATNNNLLEE